MQFLDSIMTWCGIRRPPTITLRAFHELEDLPVQIRVDLRDIRHWRRASPSMAAPLVQTIIQLDADAPWLRRLRYAQVCAVNSNRLYVRETTSQLLQLVEQASGEPQNGLALFMG